MWYSRGLVKVEEGTQWDPWFVAFRSPTTLVITATGTPGGVIGVSGCRTLDTE